MFMRILFIVVLIGGASTCEELTLPEYCNEQYPDDDFEKRFEYKESMSRLGQIESALWSFRDLTEQLLNHNEIVVKEGESDLKHGIKEIENTSWETQNLGFPNWITAVEGTLRRQDYTIKKLQYELEKSKVGSADSENERLTLLHKEYKDAEAELKQFLENVTIAD